MWEVGGEVKRESRRRKGGVRWLEEQDVGEEWGERREKRRGGMRAWDRWKEV